MGLYFGTMIYHLEIENFYSFREPQVLDVRVPKGVSEFPERFRELFTDSDERAAKTLALFGANGSGKSTVLKAIAFVAWFLRDSFHHKGPTLPCERFNDETSATKPVKLAIEFGHFGNRSSSESSESAGVFRYELHMLPVDGNVQTVAYELLKMRPGNKGKWQRVFERDADGNVSDSKLFSLSGFGRIVDKIRDNASVVSTLALFEHEPSKRIVEAASAIVGNILLDRMDPPDEETIRYLANNPDVVVELNRELQRIDVGVETIEIVPSASGPLALFRHAGHDGPMRWWLESHGTRSFIKIFPLILLALQRGGVALIDELDQSIHPVVLPEIVRWFHDPNRNPHDAQLWMSCHSASLLDDLTKEEVIFCEKDSHGRSQVYSLMDVGSVRRSDNLYKKYLGGAYGAVPQVG